MTTAQQKEAAPGCSGKTVIVVGGTRGIGKAVSLALAIAGARVVLTGRDETSTAPVVAEFRTRGLDVAGLGFDIENPLQTRAAIDGVAAKFGKIDGLVASAGISPYFSRAEDLTPEMWDKVTATNLRGIFFLVQAVGRHMLKAQSGSIVSVSSVTSIAGTPRGLPYAAAKGGLDAMTRTLAIEWAERGIRVNAVAPGWIETDMTKDLRDNDSLSKWLVLDKVPMKRFGTPEEVGDLITFLVSDKSSFITGQTFAVDGGFLAG